MNILTFDIEEWFHLLDNASTRTEAEWGQYESRIHQNMDRIFQLLDETNCRATFFCLGWVADKYPDVIRRIDVAGYEVATHSYAHQLAYEQTPAEFTDDLARSIRLLQDITGKPVRAYRAPGFSIKFLNRWVFPVLLDNGIEVDCSVFSARRSHGGDAAFGITAPSLIEVDGNLLKEFPINTVRLAGQDVIFSGGGYFRLFPYPMLHRFTRQSPYVMTYFHPRDFDAGQPVIADLSLTRRFKSYYGLDRCWPKLHRLLTNFEFIDLAEAEKRVGLDQCSKKGADDVSVSERVVRYAAGGGMVRPVWSLTAGASENEFRRF